MNCTRSFQLALFALATMLLLAPAGSANAQSVFIPVDFGAAYEPEQLNKLLVKSASEDSRYQMMPTDERDKLLEKRFPELTLPNVADLEQKFADGRDAYYAGEYDPASKQLNEGLDAASDRLLALSLRPGFSETTWQGGLILVQIYYFVLQQQDQAEVVIEKLVRLFPTQVPGEDQFPPELIDVYKKYLPTSANGNTLTVNVGSGCISRINGKDLAGDSVLVLPGEYGVTEVCDDQTTRAFIVPVDEDATVDFQGTFTQNWTYPLSLSLNARDRVNNSDAIAADLATLGERLGASRIVGTGLEPGGAGDTDGYRMMLVDVDAQKLIREVTLRPSDVSEPEGMKDALNHLWTGEPFQVIEGPATAGPDWTLGGIITSSVGGAVLIGAVVVAFLAKDANDQFFECNAELACRESGDDKDFLKDRARLALAADILYGTGAALVVAGIVMIIVDQTSGSESSAAAQAGDWMVDVQPRAGGGELGFTIVW